MKLKGYLFAALAAASYGTNPFFAINLYGDGMNANSVCLLRYLLCLPILAAILLCRGRSLALPRAARVPAMVLGALMGISSLTLFASYDYINSGIASTLLFVYPILVALLMVFFFHERFKVSTGACLVLMLSGLYLLMRTSDGDVLSPFGVLLVMLSSLTYALYLVLINVSKPLHDVPTTALLFHVLLSGSVVFLFMIMMGTPFTMPGSAPDWGYLLCLAVIPTIISLFCTTIAIQSIGSTPTAIFGALEPVTALVLSVFALGQIITPREIVGALIVCLATTLVIVGDSLEVQLLRVRKLFPARRRRRS